MCAGARPQPKWKAKPESKARPKVALQPKKPDVTRDVHSPDPEEWNTYECAKQRPAEELSDVLDGLKSWSKRTYDANPYAGDARPSGDGDAQRSYDAKASGDAKRSCGANI